MLVLDKLYYEAARSIVPGYSSSKCKPCSLRIANHPMVWVAAGRAKNPLGELRIDSLAKMPSLNEGKAAYFEGRIDLPLGILSMWKSIPKFIWYLCTK
jgi:hypothetical protein